MTIVQDTPVKARLSEAEVNEKIRFVFNEVAALGYGALLGLTDAFPGVYINDCVNVIDALLHSAHWAAEWRHDPVAAFRETGGRLDGDPVDVVYVINDHRAAEHDATAVADVREFVARWQRHTGFASPVEVFAPQCHIEAS